MDSQLTDYEREFLETITAFPLDSEHVKYLSDVAHRALEHLLDLGMLMTINGAYTAAHPSPDAPSTDEAAARPIEEGDTIRNTLDGGLYTVRWVTVGGRLILGNGTVGIEPEYAELVHKAGQYIAPVAPPSEATAPSTALDPRIAQQKFIPASQLYPGAVVNVSMMPQSIWLGDTVKGMADVSGNEPVSIWWESGNHTYHPENELMPVLPAEQPPAPGAATAINGHVAYAYHPRQGAMSNGSYHFVFDEDINVGRIHRKAHSVACGKSDFWGLEDRTSLNWQDVKGRCKKCLATLARIDTCDNSPAARPIVAQPPAPNGAATADPLNALNDTQLKALKFLDSLWGTDNEGAWSGNKTGHGRYSPFIHKASAKVLVSMDLAKGNLDGGLIRITKRGHDALARR